MVQGILGVLIFFPHSIIHVSWNPELILLWERNSLWYKKIKWWIIITMQTIVCNFFCGYLRLCRLCYRLKQKNMTEIIYSPDRQMVSLVTHQWRWPLPDWYWSQACETKANLVLQLLTFRSLKMPKKARKCNNFEAPENTTKSLCTTGASFGLKKNRNHTCRELMQWCI